MRTRRFLLLTTALTTAGAAAACGKAHYEPVHGNPKGMSYQPDGAVPPPPIGNPTAVSDQPDDASVAPAPDAGTATTPAHPDAGPLVRIHANPKGSHYDAGLRQKNRVMAAEPFDLEWFGGVAEHHFRKVRPGVDDMPWGTLHPSKYPAALVDRSRISWTEAAYNEYCTAAAFAELLGAMLAAKAPIDLIGMASDFVADEILHVELTSRLAMELGGGAPYVIDFENLGRAPSRDLSPLARANELIVHVCCVSEAFSLPMLASAYGSATHPLTRAVLERIVKDEAPHGRLGFLWLEWVADRLDDAERARLADVTVETIAVLAPLWQRLTSRVTDGITTEGYELEHIRELGWTEASLYKERARRAVEDDVLAPLAKFGIIPDAARIAALL